MKYSPLFVMVLLISLGVKVAARCEIIANSHEVVDFFDLDPGPNGSHPGSLQVYDGHLYFCAEADGLGRELWRFDGVKATRVSDIAPGAEDAFPTDLTVFNGVLFFSASDTALDGELWQYDGKSVTRTADIRPGEKGSFPREFV